MHWTPKHWIVLGGLVGAIGLQLASITTWGEACRPAFVAGVLLQVATVLRAIYTDAPAPPDAPPKLPLILLAVALTGMLGCASGGPRHVAVVSVSSAHAVLATVQDTEALLVCGTASAPPACVPVEAHKANAATLAQAFDLDAAAASQVRQWPAGQAYPPVVVSLLAQIHALVDQVLARIPESPQRQTLVAAVGGAQ